MTRALIRTAAASVLLIAGMSVPPAAAAGCVQFADETSDASGAVGPHRTASDSSFVDITNVRFEMTDTALDVVLSLRSLEPDPAPADDMRYEANYRVLFSVADKGKTQGGTTNGTLSIERFPAANAAVTPKPRAATLNFRAITEGLTYVPKGNDLHLVVSLSDLASYLNVDSMEGRYLYAVSAKAERTVVTETGEIGTDIYRTDGEPVDSVEHGSPIPVRPCAGADTSPAAPTPVTVAGDGIPRPQCTDDVEDPDGDSTVSMPVGSSGMQTPPAPVLPEEALDITGLAFGTIGGRFLVAVAVPDRQDTGSYGNGARFDVKVVSVGSGKFVVLQAATVDATYETYTPDGNEPFPHGPPSVSTVFDPTMVLFSVDEVEMREKLWALEDPRVTISATSRIVTPAGEVGSDRDTTSAGDYVIGENRCFQPPPPVFSAIGGLAVQYGDPATLTVTLRSKAGAPLADRDLKFTVAGSPATTRTVRTDSAGTARLVLPPADGRTAGRYPVTVAFAGDTWARPGEQSAVLVVSAEKTVVTTVVRATGAARTVTATLRDDDKVALGGQRIAWYVGGRLVRTTTATASGVTSLGGVKAGQRVEARYAGVAGRYLASTATSRT